MNRKQSRELLMQILFQVEAQQDYTNYPLDVHTDGKNIGEEQMKYIISSYQAFIKNREMIDETINKYSEKWSTKRLPKAELAIMRVGVTELLFVEEVPDSVAINESVELAKAYGDDNGYKYINGVLGKIEENKASILENK